MPESPDIIVLRGAHSGRTAVVLAGGPSASEEALSVFTRDWIEQQITIGVNLPPFWLDCDYAVQSDCIVPINPNTKKEDDLKEKHESQLRKLLEWREKGTTRFVMRHGETERNKNVFALQRALPGYWPDYTWSRCPILDYEAIEGTALPMSRRTTTTAAIWFAVHLGCDPVIVLGLDMENTPIGEPTPHHYDGEVRCPKRPPHRGWDMAAVESDFAKVRRAASRLFGTTIINGNPRSEVKAFDKAPVASFVESGVLCV